MRAGVAWFALLALALPGVASVGGFCCEQGIAKIPDCCSSAMKMPGMDSPQMESMTSNVVDADHSVAMTGTDCGPAPNSEVPTYLLRSEAAFDGSPSVVHGFDPVLASNWTAGMLSSAISGLSLVDEAPPRPLQSDPLFVVLRI
jgi:hypothetical protein